MTTPEFVLALRELGELGELDPTHLRKVALALAEDDPAQFSGGR